MKKTLIALAVGAAFVAPAAYADVTLSGSINAGPAYVHSGDGSTGATNSISATGATAQQGITRTGINANYSNITIGSMEDLGGGLKLDFAYQITAPINGNNNVQNRNSHIGLVGDSWGGVWWGSNENLYERYYYTVDPLDGAAGMGGNLQILGSPGYGSVFDAPNNNPVNCGAGGAPTGCADFYRRTENTLWYDSPSWGGFTFGVYTTLNYAKSNGPSSVANPDNPKIWGGGAKYVGPTLPIQIWAAYENHADMYGLNVITGTAGTANSTSDTGWQIGVGYTLGDIFMYGNYEQLKYKADGLAGAAVNEYKRNAYSLGVKWNIATGYVGGQWIQALGASCELANGGGCNADQTGAKMLSAGYYHTLSKQTQAYIMGSYTNNDDLQFYGMAGGGSSSGGAGLPTNLGATIYGITVGLKHSF
jgi:predicted porin